MTALIDGEPFDGRIEITDSAVMRGDGCFEAIRVYRGAVFEPERHLARLARSAEKLELSLPPVDELRNWVEEVADGLDNSLVRVVVTRGDATDVESPHRVVVFAHTIEPPSAPIRLGPVPAPWLASDWQLAGAKTLSYAPNLAARRIATTAGFDDALLVSVDDIILEGPTFAIAWVVDGRLETPSLNLGVLDSVTRQLVIEDSLILPIEVVEDAWPLERLELATEVMVMSTVREIQPVTMVGDLIFGEGMVTMALATAFRQRIGRSISGQGSIGSSPAQVTRR